MPVKICKKNVVLVTCGTCAHFRRDTSGPSFNAETHIFFMGRCKKGLHPDSPNKQFADKPRQCDTFKLSKHERHYRHRKR